MHLKLLLLYFSSSSFSSCTSHSCFRSASFICYYILLLFSLPFLSVFFFSSFFYILLQILGLFIFLSLPPAAPSSVSRFYSLSCCLSSALTSLFPSSDLVYFLGALISFSQMPLTTSSFIF